MLFAINGAAGRRERGRERVACIGTGIDRFDRHDIGMPALPVLHGYVNVYAYIRIYQKCKVLYVKIDLFIIQNMHID